MSLDTGLMKDYFKILGDLCAMHNYFYNYKLKTNWRGDLISVNIEFYERNQMIRPILSMSSNEILYEIDNLIHKDNPSVSISGEYTGTLYDLLEDTRIFFSRNLKIKEDKYTKHMWEELLMNNFTKKDLQNGDIVVLRDGMKGVYICRATDHDVILMSCGSFMHRHDYNNDLTCPGNDKCDILKVYRGAKCFNECETTEYLVYNGEWFEEPKSEEVTPDKYIHVAVTDSYENRFERFINKVGYDNILQIMPTTNYNYTILYRSEHAIDPKEC